MAQLTSGTTAKERGKIFRDEIGQELVFAANRQMTGAYLFPESIPAGQHAGGATLGRGPVGGRRRRIDREPSDLGRCRRGVRPDRVAARPNAFHERLGFR